MAEPPDREAYASALGWLVMEAARLEWETKSLASMLMWPHHGIGQIIVKGRSLSQICDAVKALADERLPEELAAEAAKLMEKVKNAGNRRNDALHASRDLSSSGGGYDEHLTKLTWGKAGVSAKLEPVDKIWDATETVRAAARSVHRFAFDKVLPLADPAAARPNVEPKRKPG